MAYYRLTTNKKGNLSAKIQAYVVDLETMKRKVRYKRITNGDGLSRAKFTKLVEREANAFEDSLNELYQKALNGERTEMRDLISSGDLMRLFLEGDPNTIIRRPNVRRFAQENGIRHIICNGKWLIDYKEFFKKVNPRRIRRTATIPRLRCLRDCVTEFNKNNRIYKIDKATVSHYMNSAQVTRYFHGNTWFINYDELEKVILRHLKAVKKRKKRKYN